MNDDWCPPSGEQRIPADLGEGTETNARANESTELALGISEADVRLVDAFYHERAVGASTSKSPPSLAEQLANAESVAALERLKAMTPAEQRAERARRTRDRRRGDS